MPGLQGGLRISVYRGGVVQLCQLLSSRGWLNSLHIATVTSDQRNLIKSPHRRRAWTVQSYSPGCVNMHPRLIHIVYLCMCDFFVLDLVFQYYAKALARKNVSEMTYFVSSGT